MDNLGDNTRNIGLVSNANKLQTISWHTTSVSNRKRAVGKEETRSGTPGNDGDKTMHSGVTTGQNHKTDSRRNRPQETPPNIPPIANEVLVAGTDTSYTESDSDMRNMSEEGPIRLEQTQISEKDDLLNKVLTTHVNVISRFFWEDSSGIKRIQIHFNGAGFIHKVYLAHTNKRHRCKDCR